MFCLIPRAAVFAVRIPNEPCTLLYWVLDEFSNSLQHLFFTVLYLFHFCNRREGHHEREQINWFILIQCHQAYLSALENILSTLIAIISPDLIYYKLEIMIKTPATTYFHELPTPSFEITRHWVIHNNSQIIPIPWLLPVSQFVFLCCQARFVRFSSSTCHWNVTRFNENL